MVFRSMLLQKKPGEFNIKVFKHPRERIIYQEECLLAQGLLCRDPATRSGCDAACVSRAICLAPAAWAKPAGYKVKASERCQLLPPD